MSSAYLHMSKIMVIDMKDNIQIEFTIFNKSNGILTKEISINEDGKIIKDSSQCYLNLGKAFVNRCKFSEFPSIIRTLKKNECIAHGIFDDTKYGDEEGNVIVTTDNDKNHKYQEESLIISRTKKFFNYPESNAICMFDYDVDPDDKVLSIEEYIEVMSDLIPGFDKCAKTVTPSTSSCIYDQDHNLISGQKPSFHMYFVVKNPSDIKRFKDVLFKKCWLHGYDKIHLNSKKNPLTRTIFDQSVFSPERLDFVSGAFCKGDIYQKLPVPIYHEGNVLDTEMLKDLSVQEEIEYMNLVDKNIYPYKEKNEQYKEKRKSEYQTKYKCSYQKASSYINDLDEYILWNKHILYLDDNTQISCKELLDKGVEYDGVTMSDPSEPKKGRNKARFYWNDGKNPIIHSFVDGEKNYSFKKHHYNGGKIESTDKKPTFGADEDFLSIEQSREECRKELEMFFTGALQDQLLIMDAGIGKSTTFMKVFSSALKKTNRLYSIKVAYLVPDNDLSLELLQKYQGDESTVGMPCMIRGRAHYNDHLVPPCKIAELFLKSDISITDFNDKMRLITSDTCKECKYRNNCEYIRQFDDARHAHLVFMSHSYGFTLSSELTQKLKIDGDGHDYEGIEDLIQGKNPRGNKNQKSIMDSFTHLVIDEDIVGSMILDSTDGRGVFHCDRQDSDIVKGIVSDVETGADIKHVLLKWKEEIEDEYKKHRKVQSYDPVKSISDFDNDEQKQAYALFKQQDYKRTFWRFLKQVCENLHRYESNDIFINNVWVNGNELKISKKQKLNSMWDKKKLLYIDASADPDVVQKALNRRSFKIKRIRTKNHNNVLFKQVHNNLFSKNHLTTNFTKIFQSLNNKFKDKITAIITHKQIKEMLRERNFFDKDTVIGHYKKIRGTDNYKGMSHLFIIGRYSINPDVLKEKARMLYPITTETLDFSYMDQDFVYRMKDGQNYQVKQKDYPINSPVWKLNNHLSRSETEQAISRIRPFDVNHESGKQTVYILTSQVLDITVDELIPSNDFLLTSPRKTGSNIRDGILAVLERNGGIIRWKPSEIASELNIDPRQLYEAKKQLWFSDNVDWSLRIVTYVRIDKKSSKKLIKDKLIVLNNVDVDEQAIKNLNKDYDVRDVSWK